MNRPLLLALATPLCLLAQDFTPHVATKPAELRATPATLREAIDQLPEADLKELLSIVREHYLAPEKLDDLAVSRAAAQGLFERFAPGIVLPLDGAPTAQIESPFRSEIIEERTGY